MIKRILVGLGGTSFTDIAIKYSVELAKIHKAELTGITVIDIKKLEMVGPVPVGADWYAKELREHRLGVTREKIEEAIAKFTSACKTARIRCRIEKECGDPFDLMISHARYHDLIVFGVRSLFDYGLVEEPQDALYRLIREGVRPLIAVPNQYRRVRRVLIAYSGSMGSAKAMKKFIQLHPWPEVKVRIFCFGKKVHEAKKLLSEASGYCKSHGFDVDTKYVLASGKDQLLQDAKEWKADLIVMGNSMRSVLLGRVLGSVALHTIRNSEVPLFLMQ